MKCHTCGTECSKFGKRAGGQRYQCRQCKRTFTETRSPALNGMYTDLDTASRVLQMLVEGCSVSTVERLTEIHHSTILKLLVLAGEKCERIMGERVRNVEVRDVECDEAWSFIGKKQNVSARMMIRTWETAMSL